jgi:glycolate oxidase
VESWTQDGAGFENEDVMAGKVNDEIIQQLIDIAGPENVIWEGDRLEPYSRDETVGLQADPDAVVRVTSAEQVSEILKLANRVRVPVVPRGAGYGLSGGAVPTQGGIVLSLEKMNRVLEIDKRNLMVTVEPGVITGDLHRTVEAEGLFYPPDPASLDSCTIGGNVAMGAGGPRAVKYGTTKDYLCGVEAVLPSGDIVQMGGKLVKNVTGYDLMHLLVGSEGTLAVVTKIILRLVPLPAHRVDLLVPFDSVQAAADVVAAIIARRVVPTTIEFMERGIVQACERFLDKEIPYSDAAAQLLIQLDGNNQDALDQDYELVGELCLDEGALDVLVAADRPTRDRLWEARRALMDALNFESPVNQKEDVVVPRAQIPALMSGIELLSERLGVRFLSFGHAGDGNVHVTALKDDLDDETWNALVPRVTDELYRLSLSLGGTITGEHGIGATRRTYLSLALEEAQIDVMRRVRAAFDPNGVLNPAKIFP